MTRDSGKVVWKIKESDFFSGSFDDANTLATNWPLTTRPELLPHIYQNHTITIRVRMSSSASLCEGSLALLGTNLDDTVMMSWNHEDLNNEVKLIVDCTNWTLFYRKFLHPDMTYRIEFRVHKNQNCRY